MASRKPKTTHRDLKRRYKDCLCKETEAKCKRRLGLATKWLNANLTMTALSADAHNSKKLKVPAISKMLTDFTAATNDLWNIFEQRLDIVLGSNDNVLDQLIKDTVCQIYGETQDIKYPPIREGLYLTKRFSSYDHGDINVSLTTIKPCKNNRYLIFENYRCSKNIYTNHTDDGLHAVTKGCVLPDSNNIKCLDFIGYSEIKVIYEDQKNIRSTFDLTRFYLLEGDFQEQICGITLGNFLNGPQQYQPFSTVLNMTFLGKDYGSIGITEEEMKSVLGNRKIGQTEKEGTLLNIDILTEEEEILLISNSIHEDLKTLTTNKCP